MIPVPRGPLLGVLIIPLIFIICGIFQPLMFNAGLAIDIVIVIVCILDVLISKSRISFQVNAENSKLLSIGRKNSYSVYIKNMSPVSFRFQCTLSLPEFIEDKTGDQIYRLRPGRGISVNFTLRPARRGAFDVEFLHFRIHSYTGLFYLSGREKIDVVLRVFPDIKKLKYFLKMVKNDRAHQLGIHKNRWKGMGSELESLRDYQADDDSRNIDWKASTRVDRPITKVFQMESNNHITIAIDCGRLMTAEQNGLSTLDHAVNSLLILSHVAFKAGDLISIIAYSDRIISELHNIKGKASLSKITKFITGLEPEYVESNYAHIFKYIDKKIKRRSLVIFLTDMIDDINYNVFENGINMLSKRHLVLFILLRDVVLSQLADRPVSSIKDMRAKTAAREMFLNRNDAISKLRYHRINVLDVLPHQLTGRLIDRYIEIKSKSLL